METSTELDEWQGNISRDLEEIEIPRLDEREEEPPCLFQSLELSLDSGELSLCDISSASSPSDISVTISDEELEPSVNSLVDCFTREG